MTQESKFNGKAMIEKIFASRKIVFANINVQHYRIYANVPKIILFLLIFYNESKH